jgi:hypothetical protein
MVPNADEINFIKSLSSRRYASIGFLSAKGAYGRKKTDVQARECPTIEGSVLFRRPEATPYYVQKTRIDTHSVEALRNEQISATASDTSLYKGNPALSPLPVSSTAISSMDGSSHLFHPRNVRADPPA